MKFNYYMMLLMYHKLHIILVQLHNQLNMMMLLN